MDMDLSPNMLKCRDVTIYWRKKIVSGRSFAAEPGLDACQNVFQVGLGNLVVDLPAVALAGQKPAPLHEPQVLRGHVAGDLARFGKLPDCVLPLEQHLDHSQPVRMGQGLEAFRGLRQGIHREQLAFGGHRHFLRRCADLSHGVQTAGRIPLTALTKYIVMLRYVNPLDLASRRIRRDGINRPRNGNP
jgi:hypothetical protein